MSAKFCDRLLPDKPKTRSVADEKSFEISPAKLRDEIGTTDRNRKLDLEVGTIC